MGERTDLYTSIAELHHLEAEIAIKKEKEEEREKKTLDSFAGEDHRPAPVYGENRPSWWVGDDNWG